MTLILFNVDGSNIESDGDFILEDLRDTRFLPEMFKTGCKVQMSNINYRHNVKVGSHQFNAIMIQFYMHEIHETKYCIFVKWLIVAITCNLNMKSKSLPCVAEI